VLYEMTTLKHPFDADSLVILASKILKDQYPPPDASFSVDLCSLIKIMLSKDARIRPSVHEVLKLPFLQETMHESNRKFALGLSLPVLELTPEGVAPAVTGGEAPELPSTADRPAEVTTANAEVEKAAAPAEDGDAVLMGTVAVAPTLAAPEADAGSPARPGGHDDDYEEEFEDYSGSEDGDKEPPSDLRASVRNLKLGQHDGAARPAMDPISEGGAASAAALANVDAAGGSRVGAKADSLRTYLCSQVSKEDFEKAYGLVRAATEGSAETLQQQVGEIIGAEKATELFTLFQLLCFLEDVAANSAASDQQAQ